MIKFNDDYRDIGQLLLLVISRVQAAQYQLLSKKISQLIGKTD